MRALRSIASLAIAIAMLPEQGTAASAPPSGSWAQYYQVKTVMQRLYAADPRFRPRVFATNDANVYGIDNCMRGSEFTGESRKGNVTADFADIALDVTMWHDGLRRAGFPAAVWQAMLVRYERQQVDRAIAAPGSPAKDDAFKATLVNRLNAYRATHPRLPRAVVGLGCGAGEGTVLIATAPAGGQVLFIPSFFYQLCRVEKRNADDPSACPRWREAVDGKLQSVAGDYLYRVRWPDGTTRRGTLRFDLGDDGKTITLRKP